MSRRSLVLTSLVAMLLLLLTSTPVLSQGVSKWVSPTGFEDSGDSWNSEPSSYDDDTGSSATTYCDAASWSDFLVLTIEPTWCSGIRYWSFIYGICLSAQLAIDIDLYYDNTWNDLVYESFCLEGAPARFVEVPIGSTERVSAMRVRFYSNAEIAEWQYAREFDFGRSHPTNVRNILGTLPTVAVAVLILVFGMIMVSTSLGGFLPSILMGAILIVVFVGLLSPLTSMIGLVP